PVLDAINDMRAAFQHLVDLFGGDAVPAQEPLRSAGRKDPEAELLQEFDRFEDTRLVAVAHGNKNRTLTRRGGTAADLALGESHVERCVESHHLAGRFHLWTEHG